MPNVGLLRHPHPDGFKTPGHYHKWSQGALGNETPG